jgi:hypothetical protein
VKDKLEGEAPKAVPAAALSVKLPVRFDSLGPEQLAGIFTVIRKIVPVP